MLEELPGVPTEFTSYNDGAGALFLYWNAEPITVSSSLLALAKRRRLPA